MFDLNLTAGLAICAYLGSTICLVKEASQQQKQTCATYLAWLAVMTHSIHLGLFFSKTNGFDFSFFNTASMVSALVVLLLLLASLTKPILILGIIIFPLAVIMQGLDIIFPHQFRYISQYHWQMKMHIFSSIIAFSLFTIAALQALFLALQEKQLRCHPPKKFIATLPALQTMELLLFQMITVGLIFLSGSLITGIVFIDDLFAQHLAHKTLLSIIAWCIFSALLAGRMVYGWRGQTAIKLTLSGFVLLLLAYFGSKLVLEIILNKL